MSVEVMRQALSALLNHTEVKHPHQKWWRDSAIEALERAIAEAEKAEILSAIDNTTETGKEGLQ